MRRPLRSVFVLGVLVGLVLALARALARDARPAPTPLAAPPPPLPAVTPPVRTPVPLEVAPPVEPVITPGGNPPDPIAGSGGVEQDAAEGSWVEPVEGGCPDGYPIKAKTSSGIYHRPGGLSYERTRPDRCYADEASAESDGFRAAKR